MDIRINPFHELYVTETIGPDRFVKLFSPFLVEQTLALFQPGNVILKGVQGSGKSMLLGLLKPEIRIAYAKANEDFPIKGEFSKFIGAGINLTMCGILDFGQRPIITEKTDEKEHLPIYFGDFFNYWIVADIINSIEKLSNELDGKIARELGIITDKTRFNEAAIALAADDCWFGYFEGIKDIPSLKQRLFERITSYRAFLNYNKEEIPSDIRQTKTSVGIPISITAQKFREHGIVPKDVNFYIRIDQFEQLGRLEGLSSNLGPLYKQVINKAIGTRDSRVSYRIGSRRYGWRDELRIYSTDSSLEESRDYKIIDLDELLRRQESSRGIFPAFADDVFSRRLMDFFPHEKFPIKIKNVFGSGLTPSNLAKKYAGTSPRRIIQIESSWPKPWVDFLNNLADNDPFCARLAEAWPRQLGKEKKEVIFKITQDRPFPWEKQYWKKERTYQALMQIAGRCGERMLWSGVDDIISLSGGNILAFISICQHIWDAWLRDMRGIEIQNYKMPEINPVTQAVGIYEASAHWYEKIAIEAGGNERKRFFEYIGTMFHKRMYEDSAMSNPGHNGFSLKESELSSDNEVRRFLDDAVDFGDLHDAPHTTKTKDKAKRKKWYLNPILSPYFRIPVIHTKEPMYVNVQDVRKWISDANATTEGLPVKSNTQSKKPSNEKQLILFPIKKNKD